MKFKSVFIFLFACFFSLNSVAALYDSKGTLIHTENKWVILNYWADWCDICLAEIPELNRFFQHNQNKQVLLLGVNYDQLPKLELRQSVQKMNIQFPVLLNGPAEKWKLDPVDVLPTTFIIAPNGLVVKKIVGPNTEQSLLAIEKEISM